MKLNMILITIMVFVLVSVSALASVAPACDQSQTATLVNGRIVVYGTICIQNGSLTMPAPFGTNVTIMCIKNGGAAKNIVNATTGSNGFFSAVALTNNCDKDDEAWTVIAYNGGSFESEHVTVLKSGGQRWADIDSTFSVPEFTTITLGVAIAGAMLGLVFLRKNQ
jgi:hypothetical protein